MELNQAMLLVARALDRGLAEPADEGLTEVVRAALLELIATGRPAPGLRPDEEAAISGWAAERRTGAGDPVGELYQQMLRREIIRTDDRLDVREARGQHRRSGAYYTSETVVRYMVDRAREILPDAASLIDPACGAGIFLQMAQEAYAGRLSRLMGWDLDRVALALCRTRLPAASLVARDALLDAAEGGYDLCLGNPPYISSGLRGAVSHSPERLRALRERYPASAEYKLNTYPLFIERGLELLCPGGVLGFIVPDSFLTGRYFAGLRRLLLRYTLVELTLIQRDFWAHGRVGQSVILFVRKDQPGAGHRVRIRICAEPAELHADPWEEVSVDEVAWGPQARFRLVVDQAMRQAFCQMEQDARPLSYWLRSYSGLIGRRGQASLLASPSGSTGPEGRLLRSGREIDRYRLDWGGARVCLEPSLIKSGGNRAYYERPKLLLRQTADSLRAVYDDQGYYCLNNIHLLVPARDDANLRALLGVINSRPFGRLYGAVAMEAGRLYAQVDLDLLESLPVPNLSADDAAELEILVRERESAASEKKAAQVERQIDAVVERFYGLG